MSRNVTIWARIKALDLKNFTDAFLKVYPCLVENSNLPKSEGDVICCFLDGYHSEKDENGFWHVHGGVESSADFEYYKEFFEWCVPYVDPKSSFFWSEQCLKCNDVVYWINYVIEKGSLKIKDQGLRGDISNRALNPTIFQVIEFLKDRWPTAKVLDGRYALIIGLRGYCSDDSDDSDDPVNWNRCELGEYGVDDPADRGGEFAYFVMTFKATQKSVSEVVFDGPVLDWNKLIWSDKQEKADDLIAAIQKFVKLDYKHKIEELPWY